MKKKTFSVSSAFIISAYNDACREWKKKLETKFPELFAEKATAMHFSVGDILTFPFLVSSDRNQYILAHVDTSMVSLICTQTGNRWHTPVKVSNLSRITESEFKELLTDYYVSKIDEVLKNGKPVTTPKIPDFVSVDEDFILEAYDAANETLAAEIKAMIPDVFDKKYIKLVKGRDPLVLSTTFTNSADGRAQFIIGRGIAPTRSKTDSCIIIPKSGVSAVEVTEDKHNWIVSFVAAK